MVSESSSSTSFTSSISITPWTFGCVCVLSLFVLIAYYSPNEQNFIKEYGPVEMVYQRKQMKPSLPRSPTRVFPTVIPTKELCLDGDLVGTRAGAGHGNVAFEMLTLIGLSRYLNRRPVITANNTREAMVKTLKNFPNLWEFIDNVEESSNCGSAEVTTGIGHCCMFDGPAVEKMNSEWSNASSIRLGIMYGQSFKYFQTLPMRRIMYLLKAPYPTVRWAKHGLFPEDPKRDDNTNICVHIRRGDFVNNAISLPSDEHFINRGLAYITEKEKLTPANSGIYVMSNDMRWAQNVITHHFPNALYARKNNAYPPNAEWEFSKLYCDIVLHTASVSTYGWWIAFLSRGQRIYYSSIYSVPGGIERDLNPADFFPPHWISLELQNNETIVEKDRT